ncbi:integrase, catalytic region, zinc finger, CCHC-type containing protein, partial [Tanacetum coccineum]
MSYEDIRPIFERVWDQNQSFVPKDSEIEKEVMKRFGFDFQKPPAKRQKIGEVSESVEEQSAGKEKEVKYPIIDWEVFTEESRSYWRIIRVGNHTEVYQVFEDMLKTFDRDDLEKLWDLVKKKFSSTEPTIDKEKVLWVELKRLFEQDDDYTLWKLQRYMHDPLKWKLYDTCGVHHVSTERGHDIFMLVEKDYPLTRALMTVMFANKHQVDESSEMANELLRKIFYQELEVFERILSGPKGKSKKYTHKPKTENTIMEVLYTLHMDLCGPMRVQTINGKKYFLVIVDDYSRFTWVKFIRSKDETPEFVIKFLKQIYVGLNKTVRYIRTDNSTERNRTLVEAAQTMLLFFKALMFLWAEVVATAFFGDLGKLKAITDIGIFVGYAPNRKGYRMTSSV